MAHCVYSAAEGETSLLKGQGVWVAHCPVSNTDIASGIAPVRRFLDEGLRVGLGTDVAGGYSPSLLHVMAEAVKVSKLRWRLVDEEAHPLTLAEAFYLATKGGGSFWGKVGSFEAGYEFDAVVLDDNDALTGLAKGRAPGHTQLPLEQRLEQLAYLAPNTPASAKYVAGQMLAL
jgi:guanine deaminase